MKYYVTTTSGKEYIIETNDIERVKEATWVKCNDGQYLNMKHVEFIRKAEDWE